MRIGSLFSGAGGLDMAVEAVFGGEVVWQSEMDKAASKVLAYRYPGVPNLGDITKLDLDAFDPVDVLCGGFPCQDVSAAGKRAGIKDGTRSGLWSVFAEVIDRLRPPIVVIENVRGLLSARAHRNVEPADGTVGDQSDGPVLRAAGAVLGDLADLGYDAQWATVAAGDVGAPHRRERVFILATHAGYRDESERAWQAGREAGQRFSVRGIAGCEGEGTSADSLCPAVRFVTGAALGTETGPDSGDRSGDHRGERADVELLPTPCVVDRLATTDMSLEQWDESRRSQKERGVGSFGPRGDSLGAAVLRVEEGTVDQRPDYSSRKRTDVELLPTPSACNANDGEGTETWLARREVVKARVKNGNGMGMPLAIAVQLLPTPTTQDGANTAGPSQFNRNTLPLNAEVTLLPTPRSSNCFGVGLHGGGGMDLRTTVSLLPTPNAQDGNGGGRYSGKPGSGHQSTLPGEARLLCTPSASDGAGGKTSRSGGRIDEPLLGGQVREMETAWGKYAPAIHRWESLTRPAPPPTEPNKNGNPRLSAAFSEWLMGWPAGWVTDPDIGISRNDQLRIVGNGVVPQQAIAALRYLLSVSEVAA